MAHGVILNYYCLNFRYDPSSSRTHSCVTLAHGECESGILSHGHRYHTGGFYHTFNKGTYLRSYSLEKLSGKKINAITARRMTSVTSVDQVEHCLLIAWGELDCTLEYPLS